MQAPSITPPHPSLARYIREPSDADGLRGLEGGVALGDATAILSMLPDNCVDLVHTSPPYNIAKPYESSPSDKNSMSEYRAFLRLAIGEIKRVVRPGGSVFWQTGYTRGEGDSREIIPIDLMSYEISRRLTESWRAG